MANLNYTRDPVRALTEADHAIVVASERRIPKLPSFLPEDLQAQADRLAAHVEPGVMGDTAQTVTGARPTTLTLVAVPRKSSHYNHPARPATVERALSGLRSDLSGVIGIILIVENASHLVALLGSVARAFPIFDARSVDGLTEVRVCAIDGRGKAMKIPVEVTRIIDAGRQAARLVDTPPSEMNPSRLAREAKEMLRDLRSVKVSEIKGDKLVDAGLLGIHSVGKAASEPPTMVVATYRPSRGASGHHVALVGKGVTFDTGGLHLKQRGFMEGMKCDMGGAAAVLGAFVALVQNKTRHQVTLILCLAENAIGPGSFKPDDIIRMHSGKTVEINNTDAEGRLLLGDGVSWASRKLGCNLIFDAATLTGAQMVATGARHAAVVSNDARLESLVVKAGKVSGDLVHPLPFAPEFYQVEFKSPVADMRNSVKSRNNAQSSCAAQFIYSHLEDTEAGWVHIDLAGPAFRGERGTGYGVALLAQAVSDLKDSPTS